MGTLSAIAAHCKTCGAVVTCKAAPVESSGTQQQYEDVLTGTCGGCGTVANVYAVQPPGASTAIAAPVIPENSSSATAEPALDQPVVDDVPVDQPVEDGASA